MTEPSSGSQPVRSTVRLLMRSCAAEHPDTDFVMLDSHRITYAEAERASRDLARGLLAQGVGKGTRVGLLAPSGPNWVVAWLAASRIGALVVLLNTFLTAGELGRLLRNSDVQVMLVHNRHYGHDFLDRIEEAVPRLQGSGPSIRVHSHPYLRSVWTWDDLSRPWATTVGELVASGHDVTETLLDRVEEQVHPSDPGVVLYSSGSTAEPKGAVHTQGSIVAQGRAIGQLRDVGRGDVIYSSMPLFWVGGLVYSLGVAMHAGATLVYEHRFDPTTTLATLEREGCTHLLGYAHIGSALADHPDVGKYDLSALRRAGDKRLLPPERQRRLPELQAQGLGMTETLGPHSLDMEGESLPQEKRDSYGRAVQGFERRIIDPETGREVPVGEPGELMVRGPSVMQGIYKQEREATFLPGGWYRTGDGASIDADGHLFFSGRIGTMFKVSGMNIAPREVELILEAHPEVKHAHVHGVSHPERGCEVAALVVRSPDSTVSESDLVDYARTELSSYKVPRHILTVDDEAELPQKSSGKVDTAEVASLLEQRFGQGA